ncbi:MAG: hypothetical protein QOH58_2129 [Thermoleophilaceae bacterium]|jgi:hypothetical protein|nr:hypothetical protein [Thermoleophilaceae bacterium]
MNTDSTDHSPGGAGATRARRELVSFGTYREAERAVDFLSDNGFPVERTTILGRGLKYVEKVTGRMGYGEAALRGALTGAVIGLLIGWLFAVFSWFDPVVARGWLILDGLWFGTVAGTLMGLLMHALTRGRRDFVSIAGMEADEYVVLADEEVADDADRLLRELSSQPAPARDAGSARVPGSGGSRGWGRSGRGQPTA